MKFTYGSQTLDFERMATRPTVQPIEPVQVVDRTAAMTLQVENLGPMVKTRILDFYMMPKSDHDQLRYWFEAVAGGAAVAFDYEDETGETHTVRIISDRFRFEEITPDAYSGSLTLERVG
jgi:hypothetical protein